MENAQNKAEGLKKLKEKIKDIKVAMFTSVDPDGTLHTRPMHTQELKTTVYFGFLPEEIPARSRKLKQIRT